MTRSSVRQSVHPWCLRRGEDHMDADRGEYRVEGRGELGVPITDQMGEAMPSVIELRCEVAGQLGRPGPVRVVGDAE